MPQEVRLHQLSEQLNALEHLERYGFKRQQAYTEFIDQVESDDPALLRRLAASQLHLVASEATPLAVASSAWQPVAEWVDESVPFDSYNERPATDSLLRRWTQGRHRFWLGGVGAFCAFAGLMLGASGKLIPRRSRAVDGLVGPETSESASIEAGAAQRVDAGNSSIAECTHNSGSD